MDYCVLRERNLKLILTKLNDTRNRLDFCQSLFDKINLF
jgi:hypothetical protein